MVVVDAGGLYLDSMPDSEAASLAERPEHPRDGIWWAAAALTSLSALVSAGLSVAGAASSPPGDVPARAFALHALARSVPLGVVTLAFVAVRSSRALGTVALVLAMVHACDVFVEVSQHESLRALGAGVLAALTAVAARVLRRAPP